MEYQSRISNLQRLNRGDLADKLEAAVNAYADGLSYVSSSQSAYDNAIALTMAVLAVEDGHYYETEHKLITVMMHAEIVSKIRIFASEIVTTDNLIGAVIQLQGLFDRMSYSSVSAALDLSICYFLLTGGITASRRSLLNELFGNY